MEIDLHILNLDFSTLDEDGLTICRLVSEASLAPIIVFSTACSERIKIDALDFGVDDYLVMPFGMGNFWPEFGPF